MPAASAWVEGVLTSNVSIITDVRSSARNYMIYQRGDRGSYQCWADQVGDSLYTFDSLLPYLKKSVNFTPPNTRLRAANASAKFVASAFDANGGPLDLSYANYAGPFSSYMEGGMNGIGIPTETTLTLETSWIPSNAALLSHPATRSEHQVRRPSLKPPRIAPTLRFTPLPKPRRSPLIATNVPLASRSPVYSVRLLY